MTQARVAMTCLEPFQPFVGPVVGWTQAWQATTASRGTLAGHHQHAQEPIAVADEPHHAIVERRITTANGFS